LLSILPICLRAASIPDGVGYFWSGCAGREKRGLEISGIGIVDLADKTALHLEAVQTVFKDKNETLLDYYGDILEARAKKLLPTI
jgi:hypothetical protein